ncbi:MAG: bifunctional metallophosphatase/5'-nucleotidase [Clostridia bacterium]|nr:bifunctional metallophosphatase/5'-nucleotidase [Clostridia bacterium]
MKKRSLTFILLIVLLSLTACGGGSSDPGSPASAATDTQTGDTERSGDVVVLFTGDVHCGVDRGFGYAGLQAIRDYLTGRGDIVLLADSGDNIQGEPIGTMSRGELPLRLMNDMGYDVAVPGNHEFDYGMEQFLSLTRMADFPYVSCNFNKDGELIFDPYVVLDAGETKIGFVGVCTPETVISSTPAHFKDENGVFIYDFMQDGTGERLYDAVQSAVDAARGDGAEYVIVLGHMGNYAGSSPYNYADVISHITGADVFLDGHSHDTDQVVMKDKEGKDVVRSACGTQLANVGWCRISSDGKITADLFRWNNETPAPELLGIRNEMSEAVEVAMGILDRQQKTVVAESAVELTINDPTATEANGDPVRMIRRAETNLGDLCADAIRFQSGADVGIMNGGGIRVSIPAGDVTLNDILRVFPFGNELCVIEVTGSQILDALEWGARSIPGENGGFLQVSGLSYEIHTYVGSTCTEDENGFFTGVAGDRRVRNVLVGGQPIDPEGTYTLSGFDYTLLEKGDGFSMFDGATVLQNRVKLDNQVLIDYMTVDLAGRVGEGYEDPAGLGRIVIVEEP